ncbi:DEAD/DEAH box helicase, partial [Pasteurella multocida]|uniref:DEAD/DEAH box helicase n=1 Tax=Pasteurella multocida TaxID=747 RepID=UPI002EAB78DD|nr:DEAD/DEAH box helicase [Pasteurella multocida]
IVLAPTLSLVDQLGRSLGEIIPNAEIVAVHDTRQVVLQRASGQEQIFVMTPEACLAASGGDPDFFGTIGLIVFDEVHLMHAGDAAPSRRGIDASLCLLSLVEQHPDADVLLSSAMLANAGELAAWLHELTGRKTLALDHAWKPTRQARGALVYPRDEIDALRDKLKQGFATHSSKGVPVQLKREMVATPHAFFSLNATWQSKDTRDYRFARIIENEVQLGTSG